MRPLACLPQFGVAVEQRLGLLDFFGHSKPSVSSSFKPEFGD